MTLGVWMVLAGLAIIVGLHVDQEVGLRRLRRRVAGLEARAGALEARAGALEAELERGRRTARILQAEAARLGLPDPDDGA